VGLSGICVERGRGAHRDRTTRRGGGLRKPARASPVTPQGGPAGRASRIPRPTGRSHRSVFSSPSGKARCVHSASSRDDRHLAGHTDAETQPRRRHPDSSRERRQISGFEGQDRRRVRDPATGRVRGRHGIPKGPADRSRPGRPRERSDPPRIVLSGTAGTAPTRGRRAMPGGGKRGTPGPARRDARHRVASSLGNPGIVRSATIDGVHTIAAEPGPWSAWS
jgi:hypothetical protein